MLHSRALLLGLPLSILVASCGPPPEANPPKIDTTSTPPPGSAAPTTSAAASQEPAAASAPHKTVSITMGTACAVTSGRVACWGDNSRQVLSAGPKGPQAKPVLIEGIEQATMVQVGRTFGCALTSAGKVHCFRAGKTRELTLLTDVADIALYTDTVIALKKNGTLAGIDLGSDAKDSSPAEVPQLKGVSAVTAGSNHACALHKSGEVTCWGDPEYSGGGVDTSEMEWEAREKIAKEPVKPQGITDAVHISASDTHTCVVRKTKQIACWGSNWSGELGDGSQDRKLSPVAVQLLDDATHVAAGYHHTCARRASGKVVCWGENDAGQLGAGTPGAKGMVEVQGITDAVSLGTGEDVSCAALASGGVSCWGAASRGRLGNGAVSDYPTPQPVKGVTGARTIAAGDRLSCAVDGNKQLSCWGVPGMSSETEGKRGDAPRPISSLGEVEGLVLRDSAMCVIDKAKNPFCDSNYAFLKEPRALKIGQVKWVSGSSSSGTALLPSGQVLLWQRDWNKPGTVDKLNVTGLADGVAAAGDSGAVCAVRRSGKVACVGFGYRVFDKKEPLKPTAPVEIPEVTDATAIVNGGGDMCVLRKTGQVACFNAYRIPQPVDPKRPKTDKDKASVIEVKTVKGITSAVQLSANGSIRCALLKDATVSCWGSNTYGQLGVGDYDYHWDPTPVAGLADVAAIAAGGNHACAAKKSGEVLCWGRNQSDEAGQSAPSFAWAPVAVLLPKP
jgi:alpha-tubulin suppressor-like RCC1 family protein